MQVVFQHGQTELGDLRIGGVDVDDVDLALVQGFIGNAVIEADRLLRQSIALCHARPAIGAADEFMGQTELHAGLFLQVAQRADAALLRGRLFHRQRIGVVESQRYCNAQSKRCQLAVDDIDRCGFGVLQDFGVDGTEIFGVQIDAAGFQGGEDDGGVAQSLQMLGRRAGGDGGTGQQFAQDV